MMSFAVGCSINAIHILPTRILPFSKWTSVMPIVTLQNYIGYTNKIWVDNTTGEITGTYSFYLFYGIGLLYKWTCYTNGYDFRYICNELGVIGSISHRILNIFTRLYIITQTTHPVSAGNVIYVLLNYI